MQGFLTAVRQEVTRRHAADKWALDDVVLCSEVTYPAKDVEGLKDQPNEGVYIYGLYIDGCSWSSKENRLVDSEPKRLFHPLPVVHVTGVQASLHVCFSVTMICSAPVQWAIWSTQSTSSRKSHLTSSPLRYNPCTLAFSNLTNGAGIVIGR